ncbi:UNVERIFIED_CONTAM: E3 ubiquitin-protein ligase makorin [Sesamum latifolium]|uniref:E3 ubiquitin-protein ligase makorin n=1 Tax=Sesamum latifolium TaxID=2727402 RepID=A0AAW2YF20_9LAMI
MHFIKRRVLCKFFAHGACLKGEHCEFSHDWKAPPNNICTFYLKGVCAYGSRCRYEHVKVSRQSSAPSSEDISFPVERLSGTATHSTGILADAAAKHSAPSEPPTRPAWETMSGHDNVLDRGYGVGPQEREEHMKTCEKRQKHLEALRRSQEIECSVCLERILSKPTTAERKFGILSECDHPFCVTCIRNWRSSSPSSGLDVNSALRGCPICRKLSYFVIPSVIWYSSKEEKQDIIDCYKAKLRSIDCKHFDFGNGTCPFGTSCFYKHAYRDGRPEEVVLRHLGAEDGNTVIAKNMRLSDFLRNLQIR